MISRNGRDMGPLSRFQWKDNQQALNSKLVFITQSDTKHVNHNSEYKSLCEWNPELNEQPF